jgi:D-alanyl-D-alanine carboxypeptidase
VTATPAGASLDVPTAWRRLPLDELLPTSGCDPGTVAAFFPRLGAGPYVASVTGKTGTLTTTDNGVSVFAGIARTAEGERIFAVAVLEDGSEILASDAGTVSGADIVLQAKRLTAKIATVIGHMQNVIDGRAIVATGTL